MKAKAAASEYVTKASQFRCRHCHSSKSEVRSKLGRVCLNCKLPDSDKVVDEVLGPLPLAAVSGDLQQPQRLFGIPAQAGCAVSEQEIDSSLLGSNHAGYNREGTSRAADDNSHSDILARYRLLCSEPTKLTQLDLSALFAGYPGLERVRVQLIGPGGQRAAELGLRAATLEF